MIFLKTTTFDEPERFPPRADISTKSKLSWVNWDRANHYFEEYYNKEELLSEDNLARRKAFAK